MKQHIRKRTSALTAVGLAGAAVLAVSAMTSGGAQAKETFGTENLLQSQDIGGLSDQLGELNNQSTQLYGAGVISRCTGQQSLDSITGNKRLVSIGASWYNPDLDSTSMTTEAIVEASSAKTAKAAADKVVTALEACQTKAGWHYGRLYHGPLRNGSDVWMDTYSKSGAVHGGVAVTLQGSRFAVVEVSAVPGDGDDAIKDVVLPAESRLAG